MFDKLQKSPEHLSEHGSKWKLILRRVCCVFNSLFVPLCRWRWMQMISAIAHAPKVSAHTHTCTHTPFRVTFTPPTQTHTAHTRYCTNPRLSHSSWLFSRLSAPLSLVLYLTETEIHILRALFTISTAAISTPMKPCEVKTGYWTLFKPKKRQLSATLLWNISVKLNRGSVHSVWNI